MSSKRRLLAGSSVLALGIVLLQPAAASCPTLGTLDSACSAPVVPSGSLTITSSGSVISTDSTNAINNTSSIALLSNAGAVTSSGGSGVNNSSVITTLDNSGTISGVKAINNTSVIITLTNSGTISGSTYALYNTGSVANINLSGTIAGNIYSTSQLLITGSTIPGTVGTLTGYNGTVGTITGNTLRFTTGALLLNDIISGATSVQVTGTGGSLTNTGTLSGSGRGIGLTSGVGLASLTNSGTISGASAYGIANDGAITAIDNSGSISGGIGGIASDGTIGTITNSGTISAQHGIYNLYSGVSLPGTIGTINNTGTISGTLDAIYNSGTIGTINNSGTISGKINSTHALTINGGSGSTFGTLSGGTLTVAGLTFASGNLNLNDNIVAGSNTVSNTGATLKLSSPIAITGNYAQSAGLLDLGSAGQLTVSGAATVTGGTVAVSLSNTGNYIVGSNATLISAATGSSYAGVTVSLTGITGLSASADTTSTTNLVAAYLNDYVGGNLASLSNSGAVSGSDYGVYVAATGTLGSLTNTGTIGGNTYAIYSLGDMGTISNSGTIAGNIASANALTINGGSTFGTLSGGTITAPGLTFASGNLNLADTIDVGSGTASNTGATLNLTSSVNVSGKYAQSAGLLDLGLAGQLVVSGTATITGGTIAAQLDGAGNYLVGDNKTLISAAAGSSYTGATVTLAPVTGLSASADTTSTTNLVVAYRNDYIGGTLASLSNTGTLSGSAYGLYVAATGALGGLTNTGTLGGSSYAIYSLGSMGTITNSGTIAGNISSTNALTINGGSTSGTLSGGTITAPGLTFASGNLNLADTIDVGSGTVSNTGATLKLSSPIAITGNYAQSAGLLDLGSAGQLTVSGAATVTGGTVAVSLSNTGNYIVGSNATLISAGAGSSYSGATVSLTGITGLSASADATSTTNLVVAYLNDYVGGNLASLSNAGSLSGSAYGLYVASTGTLGGLTNSGTLGGSAYAIYSLGSMGTITNSGTIAGNIASANALTINGGSTFGTLSGGTITAPGLTFASGNLNLADTIDVGSGTVSNTGAVLALTSPVSITGNYTQTSGVLDLGTSGHLTVSGAATVTGGTVAVSLSNTGNYIAGSYATLISAGVGSSYTGATVTLSGVTGLSASADTSSTTNLVVAYRNDYIGGTLASLSNAGNLNGSAYGLYVASTGTLGGLTNTGTLGGSTYAIYSLGSMGTITNSGTIAGNISSTNALTINGGSTSGTLSGGTITAPGLTFASGNLNLADTIDVGSGTVSNTGAILTLASPVSITGNYIQTSGVLDLGTSGHLTVSGTATITGGTVAVAAGASNYVAGSTATLISAASGSSYSGVTINLTGLTGLSASADTTSTTNLVVTYLNDYISGNLASLSNTGALSGSAYAVYVASTGTLGALTNTGTISGSLYDIYIAGTLTSLTNSNHIGSPYGIYVASTGTLTSVSNSGTISGDTYAVYSAGILGPITNSGTIAGNIASANALTINGGSGSTFGTLSGGTITAPDLIFASGNLNLADNINVGGGTVSNTGATLKLSSPITITGKYAQSGGLLDLGTTGQLVVSSTATVTGGTVAMTLLGTGNYSAGDSATLISAGAGSSYAGATVTLSGATGLSTSATTSATNLVVTYLNDYVGGNLASLANTGNLGGSAYGLYVASTGTLGGLTNTGTLGGSSYAIYSLGNMGTITNSGTIAGNISSSGNLTFAGGATSGTLSGGTISATGVNFASGHTSLTDNINVGTGTVNNTGATLELASKVTITGNYVQTGGALVSDVASTTSYGSLVVSGSVTVSGASITLSGATVKAGQTYTIIDAGGASTYTNNTVTVVGAHYKTVLTMSGDDLLASIKPMFADVGAATGGDAAVLGTVFDNLSGVTAMQTSITTLSALSDTDLGKALLQAAPVQVSSGAAMLQRADLMNGLIIDAVDQRSAAGAGWSLWGQVMGGAANRAVVSGAEGYKTTALGMIVGADTRVNAEFVVGGAFSWSEGWNSGVSDLSGNTNRVNSYQLTGYTSWQQGALTVSGQAGVGFNNYVQRRVMSALGEVANAGYSGRHYMMASEGTYSLPLDGALGGATLMPAVSLRWLHLDTDGYSETGAGSDGLRVGASAVDQVQSGMGAKLSWAVDTSAGLVVPALKVLWVHDFIDGATATDANLGGLGFSTTIGRVASDGAKVGAGVTFYQADAISLKAEYSGDFRKDYTAHTGRVEVRIAF